jgi:hypothetical protein
MVDAAEAFIEPTTPGKPADVKIRKALWGWAFSGRLHGDPQPSEAAATVEWLQRNTIEVTTLDQRATGSAVIRAALQRLATTKKGTPAADNTFRRKRMMLSNLLDFAVERDLLTVNPLAWVKWTKPRADFEVDPAMVPNEEQVSRLLAAVEKDGELGKRMKAFFACMYYAGLRPDWQRARHKALTKAEVATGIAATPYQLRHACVSGWLAAGVPAAQVAAWAGHSVETLLRVYAKSSTARKPNRLSASFLRKQRTDRRPMAGHRCQADVPAIGKVRASSARDLYLGIPINGRLRACSYRLLRGSPGSTTGRGGSADRAPTQIPAQVQNVLQVERTHLREQVSDRRRFRGRHGSPWRSTEFDTQTIARTVPVLSLGLNQSQKHYRPGKSLTSNSPWGPQGHFVERLRRRPSRNDRWVPEVSVLLG